jgi:hypothetical protein
MTGFLKDDLTVALDDVDRTASRIVTIYQDLTAIAADPDMSRRLRERGEDHRLALVAFNDARTGAGQTPEVGDPERAHLQALWLALKSAVSTEPSEQQLQQSLTDLDDELRRAVEAARRHHPGPGILDALERLTAALDRPA